MSKPEIFTTAYAIDKAFWLHNSDDVGFMEHIKNHLGERLAERIFQECQKGERIVSVGEPYSQDILESYQVETRMDVRVQELVRCEDCCYWHGLAQEEHALCSVDVNVYAVTPRDGFCYKGMRSE